VNQGACFAANTKECHVQAMLCIGRYLHASKNKASSIDPNHNLFICGAMWISVKIGH